MQVCDAALAFGFGEDEALKKLTDSTLKVFFFGKFFCDLVYGSKPSDRPVSAVLIFFHCHKRTIRTLMKSTFFLHVVRFIRMVPLYGRRTKSH